MKRKARIIRNTRYSKEFGLLAFFRKNKIPLRARQYQPNSHVDEKKVNGFRVHRRDCTTRAMSKVLKEPYEDIFKEQAALAIENYCRYNNDFIINDIMTKRGYIYHKIPPLDYATVLGFMLANPKGRYLLLADGHALAYINGTLWDDFGKKNKGNKEKDFAQYVFRRLNGWYDKNK